MLMCKSPVAVPLAAAALILASARVSAATLTEPSAYQAKDIITRDVAIIGGGSSGTYSAISLKDNKKSVVVIERQNHLGGHAETYVDPQNGYTVDIGVIVFDPTTAVTDYFTRLNVSLVKLPTGGSLPQSVDFATGRNVSYVPPSPQDFSSALQRYKAQLAKYPALDTSFNLTYPVDPELLMPFGDFVTKYDLGAIMTTVFQQNQGYSPLLKLSTLYMLKYLVASQVKSIEEGFLTTKNHNIQELYQHAATELGSDVLLESSVLAMDRSRGNAVRIAVQTKSGRKLVIAKKLLSTAPPLVSNLQNYDLSRNEKALFSQFKGQGYYTGIIKNSGLPANTSLIADGPGRPYNVPKLPGPYTFRYNPGINMTQVYYGSPTILSSDQVQADILKNLQRYKQVNNIADTGYLQPEFVIFSSHAPFNIEVSNEAIKAGFYDKLNKLQGQSNTFYTGAAFATQSSSLLWDMLRKDTVPRLLASLR